MQIKDSADPIGLIVPVNIVAFCVGIRDSSGERPPVESFAGATTHYDDQSGIPQAFLGENVSIPLSDSAYIPLEQGVHLHWALPDALTKASNDQGKLEFLPVPNRWLVTRFFIPEQGKSPQIKSWVVESDFLSMDPPPLGQTAVTLPIIQVAGDQSWAYLGQQFPLSNWPPSDPGPSIKSATGSDLTAVSSGVASFASYYPDSRSVFGLVDPLDQKDDPQPVDDTTPIQLTYVVTGWYSNPTNDPVNGQLALADLEKAYRWTFQSDTGEEKPAFSRYYGLVQDIGWNPHLIFVPPESLQDIQANVTIGNSPTEVLAAHLRAKIHPENHFFEQLLHFFQKGKLSQFMQPQRHQLNKLLAPLQQNNFTMSDAGVIYTITPQTQDPVKGQQELIDLPLPLADSLNELNLSRQICDSYLAYLQDFRSQLFADWYHIFKLDLELQSAAFNSTLDRYNNWEQVDSLYTSYLQDFADKLKAIQAQLGDNLVLKKVPALRYSQPTEPVIAIAGNEMSYPERYGKDGNHNKEGLLVCRLTNQVLTAISVQGIAIPASDFSSASLPISNQLPIPQTVFDNLLQEACLLNLSLISQISKVAISDLQPALKQLLARQSQSCYQCTGNPPSPVMMSYWDGQNPWLPLFMHWSVDFIPLYPTATGTSSESPLQNYPSDLFTANYTIDPTNGGYVQYTPSGTPIDLQAAIKNNYQGSALLSPTSSEGLIRQLSEWIGTCPNAEFDTILEKFQDSPVMVQPLSGFNAALLMRRQTLQIPVKVPPKSEYINITNAVAPVIGDANKLGIDPNSFFNPIRAGYLASSPPLSPLSSPQLLLQIIDVFGKKRNVSFDELICAASMTTTIGGKVLPSTAYLAPRLTQPARISFRFISSDSSDLTEMNSHPATSPVCGWLLPSHFGVRSLFLYNEQGHALGSIYLQGIKTDRSLAWQPTPGNELTINQTIEQVLANENPQLRDFAVALKNDSVDMFLKVLDSMDSISNTLGAQALGSKSNMAILTGAPIALVQAYLCLEIEGAPAVHQGPQSYDASGGYNETDSGFSGVEFPVILGDMPGDGLIGYFKQAELFGPYDLSTFYTKVPNGQSDVLEPAQNNLLLTPTPRFNTNQLGEIAPCVRKVLMLVDPRAPVHATTGILPTNSLQIPPDQCNNALSSLEIFFLVAPTLITPSLSGEERLALPTPREAGFQWSWVEEDKQSTGSAWTTIADIQKTSGKAISAYTPQALTEGWLRLNPVLLEFDLINSATQQPNVVSGEVNSFNLIITNKKSRDITFTPGKPVAEGTIANQNSIFYIHFGSLVAQEDVPNIQLTALDWSFSYFDQVPYGPYWAAAWVGSQPLKIGNGESFTIAISNLLASSSKTQAQIYFDYYNIQGLNDGVYKDMLSIKQAIPTLTTNTRS